MSAQRSRERRRVLANMLEDKVRTMATENQELEKSISELLWENTQLRFGRSLPHRIISQTVSKQEHLEILPPGQGS